MAARILLITPDSGFGELIDQVLVEDGGFSVDLVTGGILALELAQDEQYGLAILDCAIPDMPFTELFGTLQDWQPEMRWIIVPPDNNPAHSSLGPIRPDAFLTKPFYMPDLLWMVEKVLAGEQVDTEKPAETFEIADDPDLEPGSEIEEPYPWLEDVNTAAQYLARLTMETAAKAALITRGEDLWAFAGELGQPSGDYLAETVGRQWGSQSGNDLARFVTLENKQEYMLYATALVDGMVLALIFDAKTPFSKIRTQSNQLARALSAAPGEQTPESASKTVKQPAKPTMDKVTDTSIEEESWGVDVDITEPAPEPGLGFALSNVFDETVYKTRIPEKEDTLPEVDPDLEILEAMEKEDLLVEWLPDELSGGSDLLEEVEDSLEPFSIPSDWQPNHDLSPGPRSFLEELLGEPIPSIDQPYPPAAEHAETQPSWLPREGQPFYPPPETMAETRPTRIPSEDSMARLEPDSPSFSSLTYACVLIPRMAQHYLVSDVAKKLEEWMVQLCLSFDWRLEQLSIRPEYLQWMVRVHSATAPRFLMQITTRITSQRIFEHFPQFRDENLSGEFWAPGWLVITSENLPPPQMVGEFIRKTRERQGV